MKFPPRIRWLIPGPILTYFVFRLVARRSGPLWIFMVWYLTVVDYTPWRYAQLQGGSIMERN